MLLTVDRGQLQISPDGPETASHAIRAKALIKQLDSEIWPTGAVIFKGEGRKTVDVQQIKDRFKRRCRPTRRGGVACSRISERIRLGGVADSTFSEASKQVVDEAEAPDLTSSGSLLDSSPSSDFRMSAR